MSYGETFRIRTATSDWSPLPPGRGHQAVVKPVSRTKSRSGVVGMIDYIGRIDADSRRKGSAPVAVYDDLGDRVSRGIDVAREWGINDKDNLSKLARVRPDLIGDLDDNERLKELRAWHVVISTPCDGTDAESVAARQRAAFLCWADEILGQDGRRYVWAQHLDDPARPHIHVVFHPKDMNGRSIHFDRQGRLLDEWRAEWARQGMTMGLDVLASRREDRSELREAIADGKERLRLSLPRSAYYGKRKPLSEKVPLWIARYGQAMEARRADPDLRFADKVRRALSEDKLPDELRDVMREWGDLFVDPVRAIISFGEMASEGMYLDRQERVRSPNRGLAIWYLKKQPWIFGPLSSELASAKKRETKGATRHGPLLPVRKERFGEGRPSTDGPLSSQEDQLADPVDRPIRQRKALRRFAPTGTLRLTDGDEKEVREVEKERHRNDQTVRERRRVEDIRIMQESLSRLALAAESANLENATEVLRARVRNLEDRKEPLVPVPERRPRRPSAITSFFRRR